MRVPLKFLIAKHVQHREPGCATDGIPAKCAEELHTVGKGSGNFRRGHDPRERKRVPDGLAKNHNIRNNALRFEAPKVGTETPETNLYFVCDAYSAGPAHMPINLM